MTLNENVEAFVMYVTSLNLNSMPIYLALEAQIALLIAERVIILTKKVKPSCPTKLHTKRWFLIVYQMFKNIIKPFLGPLLYLFERRIVL